MPGLLDAQSITAARRGSRRGSARHALGAPRASCGSHTRCGRRRRLSQFWGCGWPSPCSHDRIYGSVGNDSSRPEPTRRVTTAEPRSASSEIRRNEARSAGCRSVGPVVGGSGTPGGATVFGDGLWRRFSHNCVHGLVVARFDLTCARGTPHDGSATLSLRQDPRREAGSDAYQSVGPVLGGLGRPRPPSLPGRLSASARRPTARPGPARRPTGTDPRPSPTGPRPSPTGRPAPSLVRAAA